VIRPVAEGDLVTDRRAHELLHRLGEQNLI
jgi:hypothetical protein